MINKIKQLKQQGFTLIELLLVVVVIAFITLYAATALRTQSRDDNVSTSSAEMQNWLNAITSYMIKNNRWPINEKTLIDGDYIREEARCSPWPGTGGLKTICPNKHLYKFNCPGGSCVPNNKYMGIQVETPSKEIAEKIAATLPGGTTLGAGNKTVAVFTPTPAVVSDENAFSDSKWGYLVSAGMVRARDQDCNPSLMQNIWLPKCEPGFEGHYMLFFQRQRTGRASIIPGPSGNCQNVSFDDHRFMKLGVSNLNNLKNDQPKLTADNDMPNSRTNLKYLYFMTFCLPNGTWYPGGARGNSARQCKNTGGAWSNYNSSPDAHCNRATSSEQLQ